MRSVVTGAAAADAALGHFRRGGCAAQLLSHIGGLRLPRRRLSSSGTLQFWTCFLRHCLVPHAQRRAVDCSSKCRIAPGVVKGGSQSQVCQRQPPRFISTFVFVPALPPSRIPCCQTNTCPKNPALSALGTPCHVSGTISFACGFHLVCCNLSSPLLRWACWQCVLHACMAGCPLPRVTLLLAESWAAKCEWGI